MSEWLASIGAAWRTILHISEWSGLSIGALAAGAALFYFVPLARKAVIIGAVMVLIGWVCLIHGDATGRADVEAQWADARKAAIAADQERDQLTEQKLEAKYQPQLAALQKQAAERKQKAAANEPKINAKGTAGCELGAAADRVPVKRQVRQLPAG